MKKNILGVVPGLDFQRRKGSAFDRLFRELESQGRLAGCVDASFPKNMRRALRLKNLSLSIEKWNVKDQLDPCRYEILSYITNRKINNANIEFDTILQIGSNFDLSETKIKKGVRAFSYHDNNAFSYIDQVPNGLVSKKRIEQALSFEERVYSNLDGVFSMSRTLAKSFIEDFGLPQEKVHYAGFGSPFLARNIDNKNYNSKKIIFVASHSFKNKGGECVLKAFGKVKEKFEDAELILVGREHGINQPGVRCFGFLDKRKREEREIYEECFESSTIFVLPSHIEAFGEVFVEAMSYGIPCIGSTKGVMPEIICENQAGTVIEPNDHDMLAKILCDWLDRPDLLRTMGMAGHKAANTEYTWENVTQRVLGILDN